MKKYLIYHHYNNLSLIDSSTALLRILNIPFVDDCKFEYYGGYWAYIINDKRFFIAQAYNLALATKHNCDLLILEEDAFYNIAFAKQHIDSDPSLLALIQNELDRFDLCYDSKTQVVLLNDILTKEDSLKSLKQHYKLKFSDFSVSLFHTNRNFANLHYPNDKSSLRRILEVLDLKIIYEEYNAFTHALSFNPELSYKYSAKLLENALDSGSDFAISVSMNAFDIFDTQRSKLQKSANRKFVGYPILFLPQIILLAFGINDEAKLALRYHKHKVDFV